MRPLKYNKPNKQQILHWISDIRKQKPHSSKMEKFDVVGRSSRRRYLVGNLVMRHSMRHTKSRKRVIRYKLRDNWDIVRKYDLDRHQDTRGGLLGHGSMYSITNWATGLNKNKHHCQCNITPPINANQSQRIMNHTINRASALPHVDRIPHAEAPHFHSIHPISASTRSGSNLSNFSFYMGSNTPI